MLIAIAIAEEIQGLQRIALVPDCLNQAEDSFGLVPYMAPCWPPGFLAQV